MQNIKKNSTFHDKNIQQRTEGNFLNMTNSIYKKLQLIKLMGFPCSSVVENLLANEGETGLIPGLGRYPGERNGSPHQYSCLENPMNRGTWQAAVQKSLKRVEHNLVTIQQQQSNLRMKN